MKSQRTKKAWAGRFAEGAHPLMEEFTSSLHFDKKLAPYDIRGSIAHCRMLVKQKILTRAEGDKIVKGLEGIEHELSQGKFVFLPSDEDIHMYMTGPAEEVFEGTIEI